MAHSAQTAAHTQNGARPGVLSIEGLRGWVESDDIDTVMCVFTDMYGRYMGKRLDAVHFLDTVVEGGTHACDYLLTADMEMQPVPGYQFSNWGKGYGDVHLVPDLNTLRVASWLPRTALVICDVEDTQVAPRSMLRRQIERAAHLGYSAKAASELEYYIYRNTYRECAERGYSRLQPAGWYIEDYHILQGTRTEELNGAVRRHLRRSGVAVESSKGEWGLGQHELNIVYSDVLEMADRHTILKQCFKEVAESQGVAVTFMAKVDENQAGSSCHVHLSLWKGGENAFAGAVPVGPVEHASDVFGWFLGGWLKHVPELMVFYAPTVNSYKRYQSGSWAPTRLAWSLDNRTAGFRIVGHGSSLRIECRIPGADVNPYLVFAGALASGLDGIEHKIEPPSCFEGDAYHAENVPHVPRTLRDAVDLFSSSAFTRATFGDSVVDHYTHFYRTELCSFEAAVTDWERRRYFERI